MDDETSTDSPGGQGPPGETSWARLARLRALKAQLEEEITTTTPAVIREARAAGVSNAELAELWNVTQAWIYTIVPARPKGPGTKPR